ncbi:MAG: hypothetical protein ABIG89_01910 [Candidatus Woesearchaeota archaeon]
MKRLVIDIEEEMHEDLEILSGGIRSLRDKIVLDLVTSEIEKQKHVIMRLKETEKRKQDELRLLRAHYEKDDRGNEENERIGF